MAHAYSEMYLDDAMANLGEAVDYAVNQCHIETDDFMELFLASNLVQRFVNPHTLSA